MEYRPKNNFSMSYASRKVIFPGVHLSASHLALAADLPSEIRLAIFDAEVYSRSIAVFPLASWATFT